MTWGVRDAPPKTPPLRGPAKPKTPIDIMRHASPRLTGGPAGTAQRATGTRTAAPISRRANASKDGGTVSSVRRVAT